MTARTVSDPTEHGWVDAGNGKWVWGASGGGSGYDDSEIRGLISANADDISEIDGRVSTLEGASGGSVDAYTKAESDGKYVPKSGNTTISGTLTATDFVTS